MEAASAVRKIPLNKLVLSPTNVRKTPPSPGEDAELKASLKTCGLKQNLLVHPSADEKGVHTVTAGGRRLKALQQLAAEGLIPADYRVPCLVEEPEQALVWGCSLSRGLANAATNASTFFLAWPAFFCSTAPQAFFRPDRRFQDAGARRSGQGWPSLRHGGTIRRFQAAP